MHQVARVRSRGRYSGLNEFRCSGDIKYISDKKKERRKKGKAGKIKCVSGRSAGYSNPTASLQRESTRLKRRASHSRSPRMQHPRLYIRGFRGFGNSRSGSRNQNVTTNLLDGDADFALIYSNNPRRRSLLDFVFGGDCPVSDNSHPIPSLSIVLDFVLESRRDAGHNFG